MDVPPPGISLAGDDGNHKKHIKKHVSVMGLFVLIGHYFAQLRRRQQKKQTERFEDKWIKIVF